MKDLLKAAQNVIDAKEDWDEGRADSDHFYEAISELEHEINTADMPDPVEEIHSCWKEAQDITNRLKLINNRNPQLRMGDTVYRIYLATHELELIHDDVIKLREE